MGNKKEIKSTSELGCMLDTERQWISVENRLPILPDSVEVKLKKGRICQGWIGNFTNKWYVSKKNCPYFLWPKENPDNPVVAWRELVTEKPENNG